MKVYVYTKQYTKTHEGKKKERVEIIENVSVIQNSNNNFIVHANGEINKIDKSKYMISVYGY